jgi:hypothetical protein
MEISIEAGRRTQYRFSPLLDGDGVASDSQGIRIRNCFTVSVPFSIATLLHDAPLLEPNYTVMATETQYQWPPFKSK